MRVPKALILFNFLENASGITFVPFHSHSAQCAAPAQIGSNRRRKEPGFISVGNSDSFSSQEEKNFCVCVCVQMRKADLHEEIILNFLDSIF